MPGLLQTGRSIRAFGIAVITAKTAGMSSPCAFANETSPFSRTSDFTSSSIRSHARCSDSAGLTFSFADDQLLLMGSGMSDVRTTREEVARLLREDFAQWNSASFGSLGMIFIRDCANLVTPFFDVSVKFHKVEYTRTAVIRFAPFGRKTSEGLKLVQSADSNATMRATPLCQEMIANESRSSLIFLFAPSR